MAIVAKGDRDRIYISPTPEHEQQPSDQHFEDWRPEGLVPSKLTGGTCVPYGLDQWWKLFTPRQLIALRTFCDLISRVRERVAGDAEESGFENDCLPLREDGTGADDYADAVATYLTLALDRFADYWTSLGRWQAANQQFSNMFSRQAIPMVWDYPEANPFSDRGGSFRNLFAWTTQSIESLGRWKPGHAFQLDAGTHATDMPRVISTDPPYYDNISYADLSDFFYVWMRRSLGSIFPGLFSTLAVPKSDELVATPYRHGGREKADSFFLDGMTRALRRLAEQAHSTIPVTIYYAFRQSERRRYAGIGGTGWETFLEALIGAGFTLSGTWPMRTELGNRILANDTNVLASSIVLVCRPRPANAQSIARREFRQALRTEVSEALLHLQGSYIAPVDLAQASIGPGMAVFTRCREVLNADGSPMSVRDALALINATLDEVLAEQEGDFDADSRWALAWFEQLGFTEGDYGLAETLSKAKNTSVDGLVRAGIVESRRGTVRLFQPDELDPDWNPAADRRLTVWEMTHHLIRALEFGGEPDAAVLAATLGSQAEAARDLAYRLYVDQRAQASRRGCAPVQQSRPIVAGDRPHRRGAARDDRHPGCARH